MIKRLALILLFILGSQNVYAALSVSKTIAIHAPLPTSVTCNIQSNVENSTPYCDIYTDNFNFKTVTYSFDRTIDSFNGSTYLKPYTCPIKDTMNCNPSIDYPLFGCGVSHEINIPGGKRLVWYYSRYDGTGSGGGGTTYYCHYGSTATFYY